MRPTGVVTALAAPLEPALAGPFLCAAIHGADFR